jgi:hypothetical protein
MNQKESAVAFGKLHIKGAPLVLYNVWDAGSAKAIRTQVRRRGCSDQQETMDMRYSDITLGFLGSS